MLVCEVLTSLCARLLMAAKNGSAAFACVYVSMSKSKNVKCTDTAQSAAFACVYVSM